MSSPLSQRPVVRSLVERSSQALDRRWWRRLERRALCDHERDLERHLHELARERPLVLHTETSSAPGVVSLRLRRHRLVLGGVRPAAARRVLSTSRSGFPSRLRRWGRYGRLWWVSIGGQEEQIVLASRVHLIHEREGPRRSERDLPSLSGAP